MTIWNFPLLAKGERIVIEMPPARFLHVGHQDGTVCLWAMVDEDKKTWPRKFVVVGTGWLLERHCAIPESMFHLGTVQIGGFVWHVFELPS